MTFDCTKAQELISKDCTSEGAAMDRVIQAKPLANLLKALIESAMEGTSERHSELSDALDGINTVIDALPCTDRWSEDLHERRLAAA